MGQPLTSPARYPPEVIPEQTACVICGADEARLLFEREDLATGQPGLFQVVRCERCGHVYLDPRPDRASIGFYYPETYSPYNNPHPPDMRSPWGKWLVTWPVSRRCRLVSRYAGGGRILDLGCSAGQFLGHLVKFGLWDRVGVELNPFAAAEARRRYGFPVIAGSLQATHFPDDYFDVLTMWDVIEHLHDPLGDLREINRILKPGGHLILSTPVRDSLGAHLFRRYWVGYELPRHLHIFSRDTLIRLLSQAGFVLLESQIVSGSNHAWADSIGFLAQATGLSPKGQQILRRSFTHLAWQIASAPVFKALDLLNLTTPVTFVWVKADLSCQSDLKVSETG